MIIKRPMFFGGAAFPTPDPPQPLKVAQRRIVSLLVQYVSYKFLGS